MDRNCIARQKDVNIAVPDQLGKRRRSTCVHNGRAAHHSDLSARTLVADDLSRELLDDLATGPLRGDLIGHKAEEGLLPRTLRWNNLDSRGADNYAVSFLDVA
ncbi:Uncharacterised protein [uncultured archaeon]|nr:Uncharacterised protein [uncultured archaeon]